MRTQITGKTAIISVTVILGVLVVFCTLTSFPMLEGNLDHGEGKSHSCLQDICSVLISEAASSAIKGEELILPISLLAVFVFSGPAALSHASPPIAVPIRPLRKPNTRLYQLNAAYLI